MERRAFLKAGAALASGGAATVAISNVARAQRPGGQGGGTPMTQPATKTASTFFQHSDFNFVFLGMLGDAYFGAADVGACLAIADAIKDGDSGSALQALSAAGSRLGGIAEAAAAAGRRVSAREAFMQASNYTFRATYFADGAGAADRFKPLWLESMAYWSKGAALLDPPMEEVRIPYEGMALPGYFFRAAHDDRRRPLLIFNNGSDGGIVDAWVQGVAPALRRGYNALTFWGPGQGLALLDQNLYFRPDWEKVITPVVDYALTRRDVDPKRMALLGVSQGGYWVPRAVAFEHRIAAAVADPGVDDVSTSWLGHLPPPMIELLKSGQKQQFDQYMAEGVREDSAAAATLAFRMRPFGMTSYYDVYTAVQQYTLAGVVGQIRCPMLITSPEGESFWPGQSQQLYDALSSLKALVDFTAAEGADLHCEPKAPSLRSQRILDWLDDTMGV